MGAFATLRRPSRHTGTDRTEPAMFSLPPAAAWIVLLAGAAASAEDAPLASCAPLPTVAGCACSVEGVETVLEPAWQAAILRDLLRAGAITTAEHDAFGRQRRAACEPAATAAEVRSEPPPVRWRRGRAFAARGGGVP